MRSQIPILRLASNLRLTRFNPKDRENESAYVPVKLTASCSGIGLIILLNCPQNIRLNF